MALFECFANFSTKQSADSAKKIISEVMCQRHYKPDDDSHSLDFGADELFLKPSRRARIISNKSDHYRPNLQIKAEEAEQGANIRIRFSLPGGVRAALLGSFAVCIVLAIAFFSGALDAIVDESGMGRNAIGFVFLLTAVIAMPITWASFRGNCRIALNSMLSGLGISEKVKLLSEKQLMESDFR